MRSVFPAAIFLGLILIGPASGDEGTVVSRDIPYAGKGTEVRRTLDVYRPSEGSGHPVMLYVHGGGWQVGDKSRVHEKARAFVRRGWVFVSVNYRLVPKVSWREQAQDIAQAIAFVRKRARKHGGDAGRLFLMGHSAGAHLVALVATDGRYLKAEGVKFSAVAGVVLLDGAGYDIPRQMKLAGPRNRGLYAKVFGLDERVQKAASPLTHVRGGVDLPPFLIVPAASRRNSCLQSDALAAALIKAGGKARVVPAEGKTHRTLNTELGTPGDVPTTAVFAFLETRAAAATRR